MILIIINIINNSLNNSINILYKSLYLKKPYKFLKQIFIQNSNKSYICIKYLF